MATASGASDANLSITSSSETFPSGPPAASCSRSSSRLASGCRESVLLPPDPLLLLAQAIVDATTIEDVKPTALAILGDVPT